MTLVKPLFSSRRNTITTLVFLIAFVICGIAWMRFFSAIAVNPSPVRYAELVSSTGSLAPFRQDCTGPSFIENDTVWRFCEYSESDGFEPASDWGLARFDLVEGEAELLWPLPESPDSQILALGKSSTNDLAVAWGSPDLNAIYLILHEGGVVPLGLPDNAPRDLAGLAWTGNTLEIVTGDANGVTIDVNESGVWKDTRTVTLPPACENTANICTLQMAHHTADNDWRMVYTIAPRAIVGQDTVTVDIVAALEDGEMELIDTIALSDLDPAEYVLETDGNLSAINTLFDQSPGNIVNWTIRAAPFMLHGGTWERVVTPQVNASFYFSDYAITDTGELSWIPGTRFPQRSWQVDQWITLRSSGDDIFLAEIDGESGPTLTRTNTFAWENSADATLLPASNGGYWVLGPNGAYIKATTDLDRADSLTLVERVQRTFENFGRLDEVNGSFYREKRALKMAAFPLVLLSLPAGYMMVFAVRQSRKNKDKNHAWIWLLLQVSAVYLIVATGFFLWFWEIMNQF